MTKKTLEPEHEAALLLGGCGLVIGFQEPRFIHKFFAKRRPTFFLLQSIERMRNVTESDFEPIKLARQFIVLYEILNFSDALYEALGRYSSTNYRPVHIEYKRFKENGQEIAVEKEKLPW